MKILIANVGSSSLKCQLLEMPAETVLTKVLVERVGSDNATVQWIDRTGATNKVETPLKNGVAAIRFVLDKLTDTATGVLDDLNALDAVGFKPVCAEGFTGAQYLEGKVLEGMMQHSEYICPMHNEACINAVNSFREVLPKTPMVGLFETFFFQGWDEYARIYPIPWDWSEKYNVRRSMGHGASHYYVSRRIAQILGKKPEDFNSLQLHLGGSSSLVAIRAGKTVDGTASSTMQAGVPQSVRSSDMDGFLIAYLWSKGEGTPKQIVDRMMTDAGIAAISGMGFDMRDLQNAAEKGHQRAQLAIDTYVHNIRKYLGAMLVVLGHTDVITVAAGTGESSSYIRKRVFENLAELGIVLDDARNEAAIKKEALISSDSSKIPIWVVPTNEEIVVARECAKLLTEGKR